MIPPRGFGAHGTPDPRGHSGARELSRVLGLWDATCVVVGAIIGVGIFFTPRDVARVTGSADGALLAWALGGLVVLLGAFTFAELGRLRPAAGGQYVVLRDAYGKLPAFLFVFCNLTATQGGAVAIISIVCAQNLGVALFARDPSNVWVVVVALLLIWSLVTVNVLGVRSGAGLQNVTVVAKLVTLTALVLLAAMIDPGKVPQVAATPAAAPGFTALFSGVAITLFAYGGWQQVLWMGGEVVDARRAVPRAILLGSGIVIVAYLAANWAYLRLLGFDGVARAQALAADAVSVGSAGVGRRVAAAAVALSAFGVLNTQFLTGPRLTFAMARDRQFFAPFGHLHRRFATPDMGIILLGVIATGLMLGLGLNRTDLLTTGVVVVDGTFFALTGLALPLLRRSVAPEERGPAWVVFAAFSFAALEVLAIAGSVMQKDMRPVALSALGWIGAAAVTWAIGFRRRR